MQYDNIVIGAGSSGAVLASRLSEDPDRQILLIEAGPDYPDLDIMPKELKYGYSTGSILMTENHNWNYVGNGTDCASPIPLPRGKVTGGTSAINGQTFLRGLPEDFDRWAAQGNGEWAFERILPYYRKMENDLDFPCDPFHGNDGPIPVQRPRREDWLPPQKAFHDACLALGYPYWQDFNHPDSTGVSPVALNNVDGIRWSSALGYLSQARQRQNLTILPNTTARRVRIKAGRAYAVEVDADGRHELAYGNNIILSAGAIGSPHLLMLSGVGPSKQLLQAGVPVVHALPGVGQNLRDHPGIGITWSNGPNYPLNVQGPRFQVTLRTTSTVASVRNNLKYVMRNFALMHRGRGDDRKDAVGLGMLFGLYSADSVGELRLVSSASDAPPQINLRFLSATDDLHRMREGVRLAAEIATRPQFKGILGSLLNPTGDDIATDLALNRWLYREVTTSQHLAGTCKMAPATDQMAVVDERGKIHGLEGLYVVDASIMPDCVVANTNATCYVIGERTADLLPR